MKLIDEGLIFNAEKTDNSFGSCCFTGLLRLRSGSILSSFRLGSTKDSADANCLIARSDDNGSTWQVISEGFSRIADGIDGEIREADLMELDDGTVAAMLTWVDRDGDKALYDADSDSVLPTKLLLAKSSDGGGTWQAGQILDTGNLTGPVCTGPGVHIPGKGHLAFFENFEHENDSAQSIHSAHALYAAAGQPLDSVVKVARHAEDRLFYWDQRNAICPKTGRLVAMFWTYDRKEEHDVDIHMAWGDADTLTWQQPFSTKIQGQITAPIPLLDGRLLAFYVHRHNPGSMRLIASNDDGKTWDHDGELVVYDNLISKKSAKEGESDFAQCWVDMAMWFFGHPAGVLLDDETILLSYYGGPDEKHLSVHWARVKV